MNAVASPPTRIGVVSFVNTLPLIDGLERLSNLALRPSVPCRLIDQLLAGEVDIALCSSIDYQQSDEPLVIVPGGLLGADGASCTVRLFSSRPLETLDRIYCDTDSHTSVVLLQILMRECFDRDPDLVPYDAREHAAEGRLVEHPEAMLLIGDKVVTDAPPEDDYPHQLDLGEAWARHTGHPFIFALWMARAGTAPGRLATAAAILDRQYRLNRMRLEEIIHHRARDRHWPTDLAREYLQERIVYQMSPARRAGLELFYDKAHAYGLVARRRPLVFAAS